MVIYWFQIFDKALKYSQTTQVNIIYSVIELHNFIKIYLGHEKNTFNVSIDILDNTKAKNKSETQ